eukprot:365850-Chlamydomonas_euryale.AAC.4
MATAARCASSGDGSRLSRSEVSARRHSPSTGGPSAISACRGSMEGCGEVWRGVDNGTRLGHATDVCSTSVC